MSVCGPHRVISRRRSNSLEHGLAVVTRNVAHYTPTTVPVVNPFEPKAGRR